MKPENREKQAPLWRHPAAVLLVLSIVGVLLYGHTLDYDFHFDSIHGILNKERVQLSEISPGSLLRVVRSGRPVGDLTLALNWYVHQKNPAGYRIVNICIHVLTAFFLYFFAFRTLRLKRPAVSHEPAFWMAFGASLLWLVHPVNTQSVTYIIQRHNSLGAMFFLLSMLCYAQGRVSARRLPWFALSAIAGLLALASKQNTAVLPFFLFLYEWFFFQKLDNSWLKRNIRYPLLLIAAVVVIGLVYLGTDPMAKLTKFRDFAEGRFTFTERFLTQFRVIVHYLFLFFAPQPSRLNLDYDFSLSHSLFDPPTTVLSLLLILGIAAFAVIRAKRYPLFSFCIIWFFGTLAVESSFIPLAVIFEHRTYLPYTFLCLAAIAGLNRIALLRKVQWVVVAAVLLTFGVWTHQRNQVYENGFTLWSDVLEKAPDNARAYSNLGMEIEKKDGMEAAAVFHEAAVQRDPSRYEALNNLGRIRLHQGRYLEALELFDRSLQADPHYIPALINKGNAYVALDRIPEAIGIFQTILLLEPKSGGIDNHFVDARINLAAIQMQQNDLASARFHLKRALEIDPTHPHAHNNLGTLLINTGDPDQAEKHFRKALETDSGFDLARENLERMLVMTEDPLVKANKVKEELRGEPQNPVLFWELGRLYADAGRLNDSLEMFENALKADSGFLPALNDAAALYAYTGREADALKSLTTIVEIDPSRADAHYNGACMLARSGKSEEAVAWLKTAIEKGYNQWERIAADPDLENIRGTEAYKELMKHRPR
jgi:tetratricopeptide (TPR) repeat protein